MLLGSSRYIKEVIYVCEDLLGNYQCAFSLDELDAIDKNVLVIVCAYNKEEWADRLSSRGMAYQRDYIFATDFFKLMDQEVAGTKLRAEFYPSKMLEKTINDRPIENFNCDMGMRKVDFSGDGSMHACCGARIPMSIGNLFHQGSLLDEWNSYTSRIVKLSLVNHTFSFCSTRKCAGIVANLQKFKYRPLEYDEADYDNKGLKYPPLATICVDYTCNLKCESCRVDYKKISEEEAEKREILVAKLSQELLPNVDDFIMAGNGEMFYSPLYRNMWINKSGKKRKGIHVKSNGMLFNETNWKLLKEGYENIRLDISIDAASREVYETVRRGGIWSVLSKNMEFAGNLRKLGEIKEFIIEFVVQQKNYLDAKHFVELGRKWNCDKVIFARIYNWGTYDPIEFAENITLFENNGTGKIKDKYREYFQDSIFDDIAFVKGIACFRT